MFLGIRQRARPGEIAPRHPRAGQPYGNAEIRRSECRALDVGLLMTKEFAISQENKARSRFNSFDKLIGGRNLAAVDHA